jgi:hypothetical protein
MIAKKLGIMPLPDMKRIEGNLPNALGLKQGILGNNT